MAAACPNLVSAEDEAWAAALKRRDWVSLEELIPHAQEVDLRTDRGATALMLAAGAGRAALVRSLLDAGADVNGTNDFGGTALMYASTGGHQAAVDLLIERGARVDVISTNGWSAVMLAAVKGHAHVLSRLLERGADPNAADVYGWTPLMRAVYADRRNTVRMLLAVPATDVNARNENGNTALHYAALQGSPDMARWLIDRGADVVCTDREGYTPRMIAQTQGHTEVADLLSGEEPQ